MDVYFEVQRGFVSELHIGPREGEHSLRSSGRASQLVPRTLLLTKSDLVFAVEAPEVCSTLQELRLATSNRFSKLCCTGKHFFNVLLYLLVSLFQACLSPLFLFRSSLYPFIYSVIILAILLCKALCVDVNTVK